MFVYFTKGLGNMVKGGCKLSSKSRGLIKTNMKEYENGLITL